jgi:D-glycero-D-manno-heptose 1,7-bisphosphate phosphatase
VYPSHYPSRPEQLRLYDGLGPELHMLQEMGMHLVMITNQSGLARGYFTESELARMHEYLQGMLAQWDVYLDGIYYCPHHVDGIIPELSRRCDCRKPQPGMLLRAAADLGLDLACSWFIGDILDDVEAGKRAGCRTILVDLGTEPLPTSAIRHPDYVARNTLHALRMVRAFVQEGTEVELTYRPSRWLVSVEMGAQV